MTIATKVAGAIRQVKKPSARVAGAWRPLKRGWEKSGGIWKPIFEDALVIENNGTVANYNLFLQAGSPTAPVNVIFINNGILYSTNTAWGGLHIPAFPAGSTITIINNGSIYGMGGAGGAGGNVTGGYNASALVEPTSGGAGGPAIWHNYPITIDNTNGWIYGGGGGGGGGGGARKRTRTTSCGGTTHATSAGGDGGAGASYSTGAGTGTTPSLVSVQGYIFTEVCEPDQMFTARGGKGGDGGAFGAVGGASVVGVVTPTGFAGLTHLTGIGAAGPAGPAVKRNSQTLTWLGGAARISGAVQA